MQEDKGWGSTSHIGHPRDESDIETPFETEASGGHSARARTPAASPHCQRSHGSHNLNDGYFSAELFEAPAVKCFGRIPLPFLDYLVTALAILSSLRHAGSACRVRAGDHGLPGRMQSRSESRQRPKIACPRSSRSPAGWASEESLRMRERRPAFRWGRGSTVR